MDYNIIIIIKSAIAISVVGALTIMIIRLYGVFLELHMKRKKLALSQNESQPLKKSEPATEPIKANKKKDSKRFKLKIKFKTKMWHLQLKVVLWKNLIIRKRHWLLTICEALIPVILFLLIAYGRSKITGLSKKEITAVTYNEKSPIVYSASGINLEETQVYYAPSNDFFIDLVHRIQVKFQISNNNIQGFDNQEQLLEEYARNNNNSVIAIVFNSPKESTHLDYTIRTHDQYFSWDTGQLYQNQYSFTPRTGSTYLWKGFLALQKALDLSFIEKINGSEPNIDIETLEFPYPPYKADSGMSSIFIHYLPLFTLFSFIFVCPAVLKRVVEEKYSGIKELMKMVGMRSWMLWLGWFIYSMLPMFLSVLLLILIMKVDLFGVNYPLIEYADGSVLFVFLILYCASATVACFFISTLFKKPTLATLVGLLLWILSYFVPKYVLDGNSHVPAYLNFILLLLPNMALHYGYTAVSYYEEREIGIKWSNLYLPGGGGSNEITMLNVWAMLIVDLVVYLVFTVYLDRILPGKYGVPESIFWPFKRLIGCIKKKNNVEALDNSESLHLKDVESGGQDKGIELHDLVKKYGKATVVNKLSLDIYKNQITVLLGHNGAGKTTTMGMITGMIKKTSGAILMNGRRIESRYDITGTIGLCTQHNLFFPDLTVAEHLKFFAMLKGKSCQESDEEIEDLLKKLDLEEKTNDMAHTLSGGMKRKLCLGIAVVGGSKILILDEPSSGMDPESRRHMWDLLLNWRNDRTILITTHFMEEADALGDWIAIMDEGKLRCHGTPMDLKKDYETGYNLNLLIQKNADIPEAIKDLKEEIRKFIKDSKLKSTNGNEVVFLLPFGNNYIKMFEHLEACKDEFKIDNISFTTTTLEDVFLNTKGTHDDVDNTDVLAESIENALLEGASKVNERGYVLTLQALLFKRYKFIYRKLQTYLIPSFIALLFLLLCIYLGQGANDYSSSGGPALKMSLSSYGKTTVMFNNSDDPNVRKMKNFYGRLITNEKSDFRVVSDVSDGIVKEGVDNLPYYKHHMIAAAEFTRNQYGLEAVAMYNNLALHSAPISLNLITNTLAKAILGEQYSITMTNHPLDNINSDTTADQLSEVQIGLLWLIIMPLGFLFFLGSFIYFPYVELSTNFTQLQFMCGVSAWLYWLTTYISDLVGYAVFALIMAIITLAWTPFRGLYEFLALLLILVLYGICGIPYSYLFGRRKSFSGVYALFIIMGIMLGVILTIIVTVLEESGDDYYLNVGDYLRKIYLVLCPQFGFTYLGVKYSRKVISNYNFDHMPRLKLLTVCNREEPIPCCAGNGAACQEYKSYWNLLKPDIGWVFLGAFIYLMINILIHSYRLRKICNMVRRQMYKFKPQQCSIGQTSLDFNKDDTLKVNSLKKSYSGKAVVSNVEFSLQKGQCMGILGVNGAGKTTTFRMLTREEVKDDGTIKIGGVNVDEEKYLRKLGYCPQNDALNYSLTGRDILRTMAWLRGIKDEKVVDDFLDMFELKQFADIPCEYYSGGNKRKLSFAVAVIGIPDVILLDEPTNGVDPSSRRKFWSLIKNIKRKCNTSFVLTSHSMAECEALCNDLKIMNQGEIKKNGTIAKLKDELNGFDVKMKLKQSADKVVVDEVDSNSSNLETKNDHSGQLNTPKDFLKKNIKERYPGAEIKDEHPGLLHYYIKAEGSQKRWSKLFQQFEELKSQFSYLIEDYSISEASLEDVFLDVARENKTDTTNENKKKSEKSLQ